MVKDSPIVKVLQRLSALATERNTVLELALCHGAVVTVAYQSEAGLPGEVRSNDIAVELAEAVHQEQHLRIDWLETDIAIFIAEAASKHRLVSGEFAPGVVISANSSARVLAMKLHLLRLPLRSGATDLRDAEFLLEKINIPSPGQIKYIYARAFPTSPLSDRAENLIQRAFHARSAAKPETQPC